MRRNQFSFEFWTANISESKIMKFGWIFMHRYNLGGWLEVSWYWDKSWIKKTHSFVFKSSTVISDSVTFYKNWWQQKMSYLFWWICNLRTFYNRLFTVLLIKVCSVIRFCQISTYLKYLSTQGPTKELFHLYLKGTLSDFAVLTFKDL